MMRAKRGKHLLARAALSLLCACGAGNPLVAQVDCTSVTRVRSSVTADLATEGWTGVFPFDERFMLRIAVPALKDTSGGRKITGIRVVYGEGDEVDRNQRKGNIAEDAFIEDTVDDKLVQVDGALSRKEVTLVAGPLKPGRMYLFEFTVHTNNGTLPMISMSATARPDATSRFNAELGVVRGLRSRYLGLASTVHAYRHPINENECVGDYHGTNHFFKRVSLFAGLSVVELDSGADVDHWYAAGTPIVGVGVARLPRLGSFRINGGILFLKQDVANPLVDTRQSKRDLFLSGSLDFEFQKVLAPVIGVLGLK